LREFLKDLIEPGVAVTWCATSYDAEELRGAGFEFVDSLALPRFIGEGDDEVFECDLLAVPVTVCPREASTLVGNTQGLEKFETGPLMFVFAGLGEFFGVHGFSDVVDGGAEENEVGVEMCCRKFGGDAVDQGARGVVDENEVGQEARRCGDLPENA
jgi:hypothetical protein